MLIIRPQARKSYFYKIITFDTETLRIPIDNGEKQIFFNYDFYDGENHYYSEINNVEDILKFFKNKYKKVTFVAHNILFDLRILHLLDKVLEKDFLNLHNNRKMLDSVVFIKFKSNNANYVIQFLDSMNFFRTKLENIAKWFSTEKINIENYNLEADEWNEILKKEGKQRVQKDTEILYTAMQSFLKMPFNHGITIASTSFNTFKKQYLKENIYLNDEFIELSLKTYHGGIVMPYILAKDKELYDYDINSLYPFVMKNYPYSVKFHSERKDYRWIYDDIKNGAYNYLLNVDYSIDDYSPIYVNYDNQLMPFLNGKEWITGQEYVRLYENGYVKINQALEFFNSYLFTDFIDDFYNKRLITKGYENTFYKLIMNSLYGKFGQHKFKSEFIPIKDLPDEIREIIEENSELYRMEINDEIYSIYGSFVTKKKELPVRYNPLIASEITANARMINFDYSKMIGFEHLYYTDTDSFFVDKRYELLEGKELGKLKIQKKGIFTINAPKDYSFYGKCDDSDCQICKNEYGLHLTVKGVNNPYDIVNNEYINKKWSKAKYKINEDVYIEYIKTELKRQNKKLKYKNDIGYEWTDKKEYNNYYKLNINISGASLISIPTENFINNDN